MPTFRVTTYCMAPGSQIAEFDVDGDNPQSIADDFAQKQANAAGYEASATVYKEDDEEMAFAWASPEEV